MQKDSVGDVDSIWEKVCQTWAQFDPKGELTIRYQKDLQPGYRVQIGREYFEVSGVVDVTAPTRLVKLILKKFDDDDTGHRRFYPVRFAR